MTIKKRSTGAWILTSLLVAMLAVGCSRLGIGRSDAQIADEVRGKISADSSITSKQILVDANNGAVTLTGSVANEAERAAAGNDASQVDGVKTVVNNLTVAPPAAASAAPAETPSAAPPPAPVRRAARPVSRPLAGAAAITIPEGTELLVRMIDSIDTEKNKEGDAFRASLDAPITVDATTVIPKGADVEGRIVQAASAGHFAGRSEFALELTRITVHGRAYEIRTNQYTRQGSSRGKRTAATIGGSSAAGAVIGAIAGGGKGAAIGAAVGAGAGTAVQGMTKGQQITIPSETLLTFRLASPLRVAASR